MDPGIMTQTRVQRFPLDRRNLVLGAVFLGVAAFLAWNADPDFGFGPDQIAYNLLTEDLLAAWEQGLPLKNEFGPVTRQSFTLLHAAGQLLVGGPEASYRLILFLSASAYLLTMYLLMVHVLEDRAIAALTAVLSIVQRYTLGTSFWGMGEYQAVLPRVVVLAVFPLAWLLFERYLRSPRMLGAFAVVALGFALHLSAVYFYAILLLTYGLWVVGSRAWTSILNLALAATFFWFVLKAVPSPMWSRVAEQAMLPAAIVTLAGFGFLLWTSRSTRRPWVGVAALLYLGLAFAWLTGIDALRSGSVAAVAGLGGGGGGGAGVTAAELAADPELLKAVNRAIYARFGWTLFPISLATVAFALYNGGLLAAVAVYEYVHRWRRGATDRERIVALYVVSVFAVSLGLTAAVQLYCRISGRPDMVFELFRAFRYLFLPLYLYLGLFLHRMWHRHGHLRGRLLLAGLVVVLLLPPRQALGALPDGMKLWVRAAAEKSGILNPGDPSQQQYLLALLATDTERQAARARHRDFVALGEWVRRSTPEDAVFLTTDYHFIHYSGRDIMISYAQGAGSARSMAVESGYVAWHEAYQEISNAFASRSPERILAAAERYEVDYVVAAADQPALAASRVYENPSYALYRVK